MSVVTVKGQAEFDAVIKCGDMPNVVEGYIEVSAKVEFYASGSATVTAYGSATVTASGSATVTAYGSATVTASGSATVRASDSATVRAYGSATVRASDSATVTAYGSATVTASDSATVTAYGSATVRASGSATVTASDSATVTASDSATVRAYGSATVTASDSATVRASGSATVTASDSATVRASGSVFVRLFRALSIKASLGVIIAKHPTSAATIEGGQVVQVETFKTPAEWCDYYGVEVVDGVATVYKSLHADFKSPHGTSYAPGSTPEASDWDGGARECGAGLHFSPTPMMAESSHAGSKWVACGIRLDEMAVHPEGEYPAKCKAKRIVTPCVEVDIHGRVVEPKQEAA
jgi:hypothetical protein